MFKVSEVMNKHESTAPRHGDGQNSDVYMKNIFLVLTLLVAVIPAAIAKRTHDRNVNPTHRSPYVSPKKTGPKAVSINDRLKKVLLLSNRVPQIGTSQSTFNRQNNVLQLSIKKERAFEVREEDRECQGWRVGGDIDPSALDISAGLGD